ncbi:MAG TPA: MaoC family dehydratase [Pseudomonadales bacterium]|nr:MaoC family dehydratase [Pseudomonadales bacterium]
MTTLLVPTPNDLLDLVGTTLGPTPGLVIDQQRINTFAEATGDHQWIHVDPERAASGPFGKTIAHGYLSLSLSSHFLPQLLRVESFSMGVNYGVDTVRFPAPVPVDSSLYATGEVVSAESFKGGIKLVVRISMSVEGADRPSCIVDTISVFYP